MKPTVNAVSWGPKRGMQLTQRISKRERAAKMKSISYAPQERGHLSWVLKNVWGQQVTVAGRPFQAEDISTWTVLVPGFENWRPHLVGGPAPNRSVVLLAVNRSRHTRYRTHLWCPGPWPNPTSREQVPIRFLTSLWHSSLVSPASSYWLSESAILSKGSLWQLQV